MVAEISCQSLVPVNLLVNGFWHSAQPEAAKYVPKLPLPVRPVVLTQAESLYLVLGLTSVLVPSDPVPLSP